MHFYDCLTTEIKNFLSSSPSVEKPPLKSCGRTCLGIGTCQENPAPQPYQWELASLLIASSLAASSSTPSYHAIENIQPIRMQKSRCIRRYTTQHSHQSSRAKDSRRNFLWHGKNSKGSCVYQKKKGTCGIFCSKPSSFLLLIYKSTAVVSGSFCLQA